MASLLNEEFLRQHHAAMEVFNAQSKLFGNRISSSKHPLTIACQELLIEVHSSMVSQVRRVDELVNIVRDPNFAAYDKDHVSHVIDSIDEPNSMLCVSLGKLAEIVIETERRVDDPIWQADWMLVIARMQAAVSHIHVSGRTVGLILTRRVA